jgi:archaellum component FlaC
LQQYENEIGYCKNTINELEDNIEQYKIQINDLTKNISTMEQTVSCLNLIIFDSPQ